MKTVYAELAGMQERERAEGGWGGGGRQESRLIN